MFFGYIYWGDFFWLYLLREGMGMYFVYVYWGTGMFFGYIYWGRGDVFWLYFLREGVFFGYIYLLGYIVEIGILCRRLDLKNRI